MSLTANKIDLPSEEAMLRCVPKSMYRCILREFSKQTGFLLLFFWGKVCVLIHPAVHFCRFHFIGFHPERWSQSQAAIENRERTLIASPQCMAVVPEVSPNEYLVSQDKRSSRLANANGARPVLERMSCPDLRYR